jgi:predicted pyridoxine 5'-phosphate oxidase superfamily flavin-nucleotide-binding protein
MNNANLVFTPAVQQAQAERGSAKAYADHVDEGPARRQRIKLWGRARVVENDPALVERLFDKGYKAKPERAILFTIEAWDVNCSAHIVTRFTEAEIGEALDTVQAKIAHLEAENARLRALIAKQSGASP